MERVTSRLPYLMSSRQSNATSRLMDEVINASLEELSQCACSYQVWSRLSSVRAMLGLGALLSDTKPKRKPKLFLVASG